MPELRLAGRDDRQRVVDTVVAAFPADPVFRYLFGQDEAFAGAAGAFAGWLFDSRVDRETVWLVDGGASVAMWAPPRPGGHAAASGLADLPAGVLERLAQYDRGVDALLPTHEHWYLGVLATDPQFAGRGLGRIAMAAGLSAAARAGLPAYLETANDANVALYRRRGWDVVASATVGPLDVRVMSCPAG